MELSCLYCNQPDLFGPIPFRPGLNVVLGEIRKPENRDEDTHNLGKTLLAQVIDFCLLRQKTKEFFLFRHQRRFKEFVFFLEVELADQTYVTIRRSVEKGSKSSLVRHPARNQDFVDLPEDEWDHFEVAFETGRRLLDGVLDLSAISPWSFRQAVSYSLRSQADYNGPFKLAKFAGKDEAWKPMLAHILGMDASLVEKHYDLANRLAEQKREEARQLAELQGLDDHDQVRGLLTIREEEVARYETQLNEYDFCLADAEINRELVEDLAGRIAELNERRYYLDSARKRTEQSLGERLDFDLDATKRLFEQSEIYFGDQLQKDYGQLVEFNRAITEERTIYRREELTDLNAEIDEIQEELRILNTERSAALVTLKDRETLSKFRRLSQRLVDKKADLETLRRQDTAFAALSQIRHHIAELSHEIGEVREAVAQDLAGQSDRYRAIRTTFNAIVSTVINQGANLYLSLNKHGNPEFHADLVDDRGRSTSGGDGHTYGRLLCIAFDLAVQLAYRTDAFPHFVYHDGLLETLDNRKKLNLIDQVRTLGEQGIQHIVTMIDSELPQLPDGTTFQFEEEEIALLLHDEDESGRLFRMPTW